MIKIDEERMFDKTYIEIGFISENKAESIKFEIPDYLKEYSKKLCIKPRGGEEYTKQFDGVTSNVFTFTKKETQYRSLELSVEFFKTENEDEIVYKTGVLTVVFNNSIVCDSDVEPDDPKVVVLDGLIEKVTKNINETNNLDIDIDENSNVTITKKDGMTKQVNVKGSKGDKGNPGIQGEKGEQGERGPQGKQGIQGIQGVKGDKGNDGVVQDVLVNGVSTLDGTNSNIHFKTINGQDITGTGNIEIKSGVSDVLVNDVSVVNNGVANIDISGKEDKANKATSLDGNSTNAQYPGAKVVYDELSKRLKYKGHVNSKDDLPTAGQVSGEMISPVYQLTTDIYTSPNQYTKQNALPGRNTAYKYYVAAGSSWNSTNDSDAWYSGCVNTNYEETIDGICFMERPASTGVSAKPTIFIHVNASPTKPCWVKGREAVDVYDEHGVKTSVYSNNLITYPCWVNIQGLRSSGCLYGNITIPLKLKRWQLIALEPFNKVDNLTIVRENFVYNIGHKMFKFDLDGDEHAVTITTTGSDINENDVYTVGANYDLVRGNAAEQKWEPLAPKSDLYKTYTGYDETKTQVLKNTNGTLTWVEEVGGE